MNSDPQQPHKKLGSRQCVCNCGTWEMGSLDTLARQTSQISGSGFSKKPCLRKGSGEWLNEVPRFYAVRNPIVSL